MDVPKKHTKSCSFARQLRKNKWWIIGTSLAFFYCFFYYLFLVSPSGFRWRAIYGDPDYPKGYEIHGIDISHHQGEINWNRLKNAMVEQSPIRFVFMKATEGDGHVDKKFKENFENVKEAGLIRGVYHFWSNQSSPRRQAYFFLAMSPLSPGDLPPVLDVEIKPTDISIEEFQQNLLTWLHIVEDRYHVKPIIYTYYKFKDEYLSDARFDDYPYWIAHYYVKNMEYKGYWSFWQHTDAGKLPGIAGYVDLNIFNGSLYDLRQMLIPEPTPVAEQDSTSLKVFADDTIAIQD
ncbi:MAG: glycoside hydrolase family 25 protein [Prevotella sp.]|nr:glycoside hydrolase family 25 protein [Prevotella sp.]MDY4218305.1 glycoside hydrolase family 25 protein [Prevotella sp.]